MVSRYSGSRNIKKKHTVGEIGGKKGVSVGLCVFHPMFDFLGRFFGVMLCARETHSSLKFFCFVLFFFFSTFFSGYWGGRTNCIFVCSNFCFFL